MVPDGCFEEAFIQSAGADNLNGRTYITFGGVPPEKLEGKGKEFSERYSAQFGVPPAAYAVYGYEAAMVAIEGLRRAKSTDRRAIIDAVATLTDFDGALGRWAFDENGDTTLTTMSGNVVESGSFKFDRLLGE